VDTTAPTVTAELVPIGDDDDEFRVEFNGIAVSNGQIVELGIDDDNEVEWDDGMLSIEAPAITLTVTCTDAFGNTTVVEVQLPDDDKSGKSDKSGREGDDADDDDRRVERWSIKDWWRGR
jgi:hypothetical protein